MNVGDTVWVVATVFKKGEPPYVRVFAYLKDAKQYQENVIRKRLIPVQTSVISTCHIE